jgi:WD40 repeat protein
MTIQVHEPNSNKKQSHKQSSWVLRIVVSAVILTIIAFTVAALLILHNQGATQGISTLTIISIFIGVVIGLLGLMISFLQWHHPKPSTAPESSTAPHTLSQLTPGIVPGIESSSSFEPQSPSTQTASSGTINGVISPANSTNSLGRRSSQDIDQLVGTSPKVDWGDAAHVRQFYGRDRELSELEQSIVDDQCRLVAVLGIGGIGKTTLVAKLAERIQDKFEYVFWRSLQNAPPLESILKNCLQFLSNPQRIDLPEEIDGQIALLLKYLREYRCLLVLDNMETILQSGKSTSQYREGYEGYGKLIKRLGEAEHQSCLLLTSREKPQEIAHLEGKSSPVHSLQLLGIGQVEGKEILKDKGLLGPDEAKVDLIQLYSGNPLALKLVSEPVREVFGGDISAFLKEGDAVVRNIYDLIDQQFKRLSEPEQEIMYWLAVEREAVSLEEVRENLVHQVPKREVLGNLESLRRRSMIETRGIARFTLQPVIMEYVTDRFVEHIYDEINTEACVLFASHALIKAQAKDYVRDSQIRLILKPIAERLLSTIGKAGVEKKIKRVLPALRVTHPQMPDYAAGNALNLLVQLHTDLRGYDFSHLILRQAYLRGVALPGVNFAHASLARSVFTEAFGMVLSVAFSPSGELLAAGTADGEIRIWQTTDGTPLLTCQGHTDWVWSVAFSPDGTRLASGSQDQTIRFWDVSTGQCLKILQEHSSWIRSVAFSPDGTRLASGSEDKTICFWDVSTGECLKILLGHTNRICSVAFSPDGTRLASGGHDQTIRFWDVSTGECLKILLGHTNWIYSVAFSPNGNLLATGSVDQTIRFWDISTGECLKILLGHTNRVRSATFSSGGTLLASGSEDQTIRLWDVSSGQCLKTLQGHINQVWSVSFNPDGSMLASGNHDQTVRFWDVFTGRCLNTLQEQAKKIWSVAFSPDGSLLASGSDDRAVRLWNVNTGRCLKVLHGHTNWVWSVAFHPDGSILASGGHDQTIRFWDVSTGQCLKILKGHTHQIWSVAFHPGGSILASGSEDKTIRLWDISTGQCLRILQGHTHRVYSVAFSPSGSVLASGSEDQTICLWDIKTGQCLQVLHGHMNRVRSVAFSPIGSILASGSEDKTIRLWDINTGQRLQVLHGHINRVWSVAFSPDGSILASGSEDKTIRLWDVQRGESLRTLKSEGPYEHMKIIGVRDLTEAQKAILIALGAIEEDE